MQKQPITLSQATRRAEMILAALEPHCARISIAGSLRRECAHCGDLDLVVQGPTPEFHRRLTANTATIEQGPQNVTVRMSDGWEIGVYIARQPQTNLFGDEDTHDNWGTLLLCRTGSKRHNIRIATAAAGQGMHWNPYQGLYKGGRLIHAATEEGIYAALGLDFIPPPAR